MVVLEPVDPVAPPVGSAETVDATTARVEDEVAVSVVDSGADSDDAGALGAASVVAGAGAASEEAGLDGAGAEVAGAGAGLELEGGGELGGGAAPPADGRSVRGSPTPAQVADTALITAAWSSLEHFDSTQGWIFFTRPTLAQWHLKSRMDEQPSVLRTLRKHVCEQVGTSGNWA